MAEEYLEPTLDATVAVEPDSQQMVSDIEGPKPKKVASKPMSYEDAMQKSMASTSSKTPYFNTGLTNTQTVPYEPNKQFIEGDYGYVYGRDNEDLYAKNQSWYTEVPKALGKFVGYVATKTGSGLGFIGGLLTQGTASIFDDAYDENLISKISDNAVSNMFQGLEDTLKNEWLPTYQEASDRNKGFFERAYSDLNFWTEDVVDGAAFMASAFIPGMTLSKLGAGTKLVQGLSRLRLGVNAAGETISGLELAQRYLGSAEKIAKGFDKFTTWATATASEAMFEAKDTKDRVLESLKGQINPSTGQEYTDAEMKEIAGGAARNTFLMNSALLGITNVVQMNYLYKALGVAAPEANRIAQGALGSTFEAVLPTNRFAKFLTTNPGKFLEGVAVGTLSEGYVEENTQLAIQRINEEAGAKGKVLSLSQYGEVLGQAAQQIKDATLGDDIEASTSIGLGALLGGVMGGAGNVRENNRERLTTQTAIDALNQAQTSWLKFGDIYKSEETVTKDEEGNDVTTLKTVTDANNRPVIDEEKLVSVVAGFTEQLEQEQASNISKDPVEMQYLKDMAFSNFVQAHINAGIQDSIIDKLTDAQNATPEALAALGFEASAVNENSTSFKDLATKIIQQNDLIRTSILRTGTEKEEAARISTLIDLATKQTISDRASQNISRRAENIKTGMVSFGQTSVTDPLVDQINQLQYRILGQQKALEDLRSNPNVPQYKIKANEALLKELTTAKDKLLKDSVLSLESLGQPDANSIYRYESAQRNDNPLNKAYQQSLVRKAAYDNVARLVGLQFADLADTVNGMKNFLEYVEQEVVIPVNEQIDIEENNKPEDLGETFVITSNDPEGNPIEQELQIGKEYITAADENNVIFKGRVAKTYNNNIIKIISQEGNNVTIMVNNSKTYTIPKERLANAGKLWDLASMTPDQRIYFKNRDVAFDINVSAKYGKPHNIKGEHANKDYKQSGRNVKARLVLQKINGVDTLKISYVNPVNKKNETIPYSRLYLIKYGDGKINLRTLPGEEEVQEREASERLARNLQAQLQIFSQKIAANEEQLQEVQESRDANIASFDLLRQELIDNRAELELVVEELEKYANKKGRRTKVHNDLIKLKGSLATSIQKAQAELDILKKERLALESMIADLTTARELYEEAMVELQTEEAPYDRDGNKNLSDTTQQAFNRLEQEQTTKRLSINTVDSLIEQTREEIEDINSRVNYLTNHIDVLRDILKRVDVISDFLDFQDLPSSVGTRASFRDYLAGKIKSETNPSKREEWQELYKQLQKGSSMSGDISFRDMLFLLNALNDSIFELNNLDNTLNEAQDKLGRLSQARYEKQTLNRFQERINFLNTVQEVLTQGAIEMRPVVAVPVAEDTSLKNQDGLISETAINNDPYANTFGNESLPKFEEVGFNKTFGRQYRDDEGLEPNTEFGEDRFFAFTARQNVANQGYELMVVTEANDTFGIRTPQFNTNDIKLVVVKRVEGVDPVSPEELARINDKAKKIYDNFIKQGKEVKEAEDLSVEALTEEERKTLLDSYRSTLRQVQYIDQNGNVIENPTKDNLVYTSMSNIDAWTPERVRSSYSVASTTTDEQIQAVIDEHKAFQETLRAAPGNQFLKAINTSPGIQRVETLNSTAEDGTKEIAKAPVAGRVIEDDPDWTDLKSANNPEVNIELRVSTANSAIAPGILAGRAVMQEFTFDNGNKLYGDKITRVFTRPLEQSEKDNITEVLARLTDLFGRKNTTDPELKLSEAEQAEMDLIFNYLKGVIAWGKPKDKTEFSDRFIYIQNGLNRGDLNIRFDAASIQANKEAIFDGVFHHINNTLLTSLDEYSTVKIQDGRVVPDKTYTTYQEYLLSERENNELPPVYTSMPRVDSGIPQRTQSYINWTDTNSERQTPVIEVEREVAEKPQAGIKKPAAPAIDPNKLSTVERIDAFIEGQINSFNISDVTFTAVKRDGGLAIRIKKGNDEKHSPVYNSREEIIADKANIVEAIKQATGFDVNKNAGLKSLGSKSIQQNNTQTAKPVATTSSLSALRQLGQQGKQVDTTNPAVERVLAENTTETPIREEQTIEPVSEVTSTGETMYFDIETAVQNAKPNKGFLSAKVWNKNLVTEEVEVISEASIKIIDGNLKAAQVRLRNELIANLPNDEEAPFREVTSEEVEQLEDFKELESFMSENLPRVSVNKVAELIAGKAWGMFNRGAIYIYENAPIGTGFHEAFEAVWASYLNPKEQDSLAKEFRSRKGEFTNPFTNETKKYSEATDYDVREMLSEEFRDYVLNEGTSLPKSKITKFFRDLWNFIKGLIERSPLVKRNLNTNINNVFKKINTGGFRYSKPIRERNELTPAYRLAGMSVKDSNAAIEGMTYYFFTELFKEGKSIDTILNELTPKENVDLFNRLYETAFNKVIADGSPIGQNLVDTLLANKESLFQELKNNLERYGLSFDEEIVNKEENATDTLGIRNSITVNPQKMTNINIRLLLASLPNSTYNTTGKMVVTKNSLNQPSLVDYAKTHNILLNELSNIIPFYDADGNRKEAIDRMFEELDSKYRLPSGRYRPGYAWIQNLKLRLKYEDISGAKIPLEALTQDDIRLRIAFIKSFTNDKNTPEKTIVGEEGRLYNINPINNVNTDRVKQDWNNNIINNVLDKKYDIITIADNGTREFNKSSKDYKFIMDALNNKSKLDLDKSLEVLDRLGIQFTTNRRELNKYEQTIRENLIQIMTLMQKGDINTVSDLYGTSKIGGRINNFLELEARFSSQDTTLSYLNAEGQSQYSVVIPSLFGQVVNTLNSVGSLKALVQSAPWLGNIDADGNARLFGYSANSELLRPGGPLFNNRGNRRPNTPITYHVISGLGTSDFDGTATDALQYPERVANEIHYLMRNIVYTNINSDKSTEFGLGIPGKPLVSASNVSDLLYFNNPTLITDIYINQLTDELYTALENSLNKSNVQYYRSQVERLGHFRDVMGPDFVNKFREEVLGRNEKGEEVDRMYTSPTAHLEFIRDNRDNIETTIISYLNSTIDNTVNMLLDLDIFQPNEELYTTDAIDNEFLRSFLGASESQVVEFTKDDSTYTRQGFNEANIRTLAGFLSINKELLLTEQHKLVYGHPTFYKDLPKRANGATSTKEQMVEDKSILQWMDNNMSRNDGKVRNEERDQTFKTISFKDSVVVSQQLQDIAQTSYNDLFKGDNKEEVEKFIGAKFNEDGSFNSYILNSKKQLTGILAPYADLNEADAAAWAMPDIIRDMLFLTGKLTKEQEAQFNYEMAYEKVRLAEKGLAKYPQQVLDNAKQVLERGNPGYIFQVLKPQYFGYAVGSNMMHPVFLKNSVQPKFFRHVEGTQFEELYLAAKKDQVDVIGFESGEKVGNQVSDVNSMTDTFVPLYDGTGRVNVNRRGKTPSLLTELPQQKLYTKFWGIQVEMASKAKTTVVRGTQVTKLIMLNAYDNGMSISPELEGMVEEYNRTLVEMMRNSKKDLLKELGLVQTPEGYETDNLESLVNMLRKEAIKRELPDNMIDGIAALMNEDGTQSLKYHFDTLNNSSKIDNILNSIVDSRVISEKIHGKASVQVASTLYESNPRNYIYLKDGVYTQMTEANIGSLSKEEFSSRKMASSDLKFYTGKDGKVSKMEVYISFPFKEVTPEQLGLKLENGIYKNTGIIDARMLNSIGFRIPTQAMNSIENIVIKGFTPPNNGDMIVVPSEIVGKSGSDFDIDKLNLYLANYYQNQRSGKINYVEYKGSVEATREFYSQAYDRGELLSEEDQRELDRYIAEERDMFDPDIEGVANEFLNSTAPEIGSKLNTAMKNLFSDETLTKEFLADMSTNEAKKEKVLDSIVKKALQNNLMSIMGRILEHKLNYVQLVTPNSVDLIKGLATEISQLKVEAGTKTKQDEKSYNYLRTFIGSSEIRERYLTAKRMVGIAALHGTFHSMAQVAGVKLGGTFPLKGMKYLQMGPEEQIRTINIKLPNTSANSDGTYSIGGIYDADGQSISDSGSQKLSGFVDGAKDPFVFDLNLNMNTAGTWYYLDHHGVPQRYIAYFFNQPILDEYFNAQAKNKSGFKKINGTDLFPEGLFYQTINPYYKKLTGIDFLKELNDIEVTYKNYPVRVFKETQKLKDELKLFLVDNNLKFEKFSIKQMKEAITKGNKADPELQLAILYNFIELQAQGRLLSNYIQAIGYDNTKTKSIQENQMQVARWNKSLNEDFIENPNSVLEKTFIGEMKQQKEDVFNMFANFFITLSPKARAVFKPMEDILSDPDYFITKNKASLLLQRYQNFVLGYILHTTPHMKNELQVQINQNYDMLFGDNSFPRLLDKIKKHQDPTVSDNLIVRELLPLMSDNVTQTNNISLFRNKLDSYNINKLTESLEELQEYALDVADNDVLDFIDRLTMFSLIQSGIQASNINFSTVLPTSIYSENIKNIISNFIETAPELNVDDVWTNFHANNWNNKDVVPRAPYWLKVKNGSIAVGQNSSTVANEFLSKVVRKAGLSSNQITQLVKDKKFDQAFDTLLFRRDDIPRNGKYFYFQMNKKGNGPRFLEITDTSLPSIYENNGDISNMPQVSSGGFSKPSAETLARIMGTPIDQTVYNDAPPADLFADRGEAEQDANSSEVDNVLKDKDQGCK